MSVIKHFVSKKKRRFQQNGFDLDLTYITDNIVAMGYPSEKLEGFVRNKADDVIRFFDLFHPESYKVYNLCSERKYDPSKFYNRVAEYPFEDHNAPRFEMLKPCCEDIADWLSGGNERNVVAIHCKAGKGRTGVIICSYLLHTRQFTDTKEALQFYGERRTQNAKGVTIPSQRRYVYYYSYMMRNKLTYTPTPLLLKSITLVGVPSFSAGICCPMFIVRQGQGAKIYQSDPHQDVKKTDKEIKIILPKPLPICGDLRIEFVHVSKMSKKEKMFQYWFNTFFIFHSCPTEEQELIDTSNCLHSIPPTIPENIEREPPKYTKKQSQVYSTPHSAESIASLPLPKSPSSSSIGGNEDTAGSPDTVQAQQMEIGLTKKVRKRGSVRRSVSEIPSEAVNPVYCEEFNLNLPKWELDRAHKDKDCKQYPDTFRVKTVMANPMSQEVEEYHDSNSETQDKRHELVGPQSDLDEDSDDDDVRDVSEAVNLSMQAKKKDSSGQSHGKVSPKTSPNFAKTKITSNNSKENILIFDDIRDVSEAQAKKRDSSGQSHGKVSPKTKENILIFDDVIDVPEAQAKKRDSSGQSHGKVSPKTKENILIFDDVRDVPEAVSSSMQDKPKSLIFDDVIKRDNSHQTRTHSNAIISTSPPEINSPPLPANNTTNPAPEAVTSPPRVPTSPTGDIPPNAEETSSITRDTTSPTQETDSKPQNIEYFIANKDAQRTSEVSL